MPLRILFFAFLLFTAFPSHGQTVELSGTILDATGGPILGSAIIQAYHPATYEIAGEARTDNDKRYSLTLTAGTYRMYVREFGFQPVDLGPFEVTTDTERDLQITDPAGQFFSQRQLFSPAVVFGDGSSSTDLELDMKPVAATDIDSVFVYNEFGGFTVDGASLVKYRVFDDGTHGDSQAGDGLYARDGFVPAQDSEEANVLYAQVWSGGTSEVVYLSGANVTLVDPAWTRYQATPVSPELAVSDYFVNFAIGPYLGRWDWTQTVRSFYQLFEDEYDFLYVFVGDDTRPSRLSNFHVAVRNDIDGIGNRLLSSEIDVSDAFGSEAKLKGLNLHAFPDPDPPMLHEIAHYWANFVPILGQDDFAPTHWGYTSVDGVLGGYSEGTMTDLGNGTYVNASAATHGVASDTKAYADLELYLMGLIPIEEVRESFEVLLNPQDAGFPNVSGTLTTVSRNEILASLGARSPGVASSQKSFRVGFIVITTELMGEAEATLMTRLVQRLSGEIEVDGRLSFNDATGGRANLSVMMSHPVQNPSDITGSQLVLADWSTPLIASVDLAGLTQPQPLIPADAGLSTPERLSFDEQGRLLYWVDNDNDIMRSKLDETSVEPLGLKAPGSHLAVDGPSSSLFYVDFQNRVVRIDIETGTDVLLSEPGDWISSLFVDQVGAKIYWVQNSRLYKANLDGSELEELIEQENLSSVAVAGLTGQVFVASADLQSLTGEVFSLGASGLEILGSSTNDWIGGLVASATGDRLFWSSSSQVYELSDGLNRLIDGPWQSIGGVVYIPDAGETNSVSGVTSTLGAGTIELSWTPIADARYRVQIGTESDPDAFADIGGLSEARLTWEVPSAGDGGPILWRVLATTSTTMSAWSDQAGTGTGVNVDGSQLPLDLALSPSYPNPFKDKAHLRYSLPESGPVHMSVYDMLGRRVTVLEDGFKQAGWHEVSFPGTGRQLSPGVYHVVLEAGNERRVRQVIRGK